MNSATITLADGVTCNATVTTSAGSVLPDFPVGICGLCAGKVTVPSLWGGMQSPVPTCSKCGATERQKVPVLPVMDMEKPKDTYWGPG